MYLHVMTSFRPFLLGALAAAMALPASAATVNITASTSGYGQRADDGNAVTYAVDDRGNYVTGQDTFGGSVYLWRGYFIFDLSSLDGFTVTAASFQLDTDDFDSSESSETVTFYQYGGDVNDLYGFDALTASTQAVFDDLGSGTAYGSHVYDEAQQDEVLTLALNSDFLTAINSAGGSGLFAFGADMTTVSGTTDQYVYGGSDNIGSVRQLVLEVEPIPEPTSAALLLGAAGLLALRRRRYYDCTR